MNSSFFPSRDSRTGAFLLLVMLGMTIIAVGMFLDQSGRLISLSRRQRDLIVHTRQADIPRRAVPIAACETSERFETELRDSNGR